MATSKKTGVVNISEELRVLNTEAPNNADKELSWTSRDFWTMVSAAATNIITVLVLIGWIQSSQVQGIMQAITALVGATQVIIVNGALVWKYLTNRAAVRERMIDAQYQYMIAQSQAAAMVATEKLRLSSL